ncbi:MAG: DUF1932 domain-containing protein [Chloroflexi bacterium]|nr:DUF1932 domain-containing protein [Chloroflexota bacterium]
MALQAIAILSPGDMGHGVGRVLGEHGYAVLTCLAGRSARTRELAARAGMEDVPSLEELVSRTDLVLSILPPSRAAALAGDVAAAIRATAEPVTVADCNAVSPQTAVEIGALIGAAGGSFIDAGIIGRSPAGGAVPRIYTSGPAADLMDELDGAGVFVRNLGPAVGRASAIKMCYASLTKGTAALQLAMLAAAHSLGLYGELAEELRQSQGTALAAMERRLPGVPANAGRWIGEMEEIAATFEAAGVTPRFHQGAAEMFRLLARTPFAEEDPESIDPKRTLEETVRALAAVRAR